MEKLICSACGAPLAPNTNEPFLTCEYCDTTVANKYYAAPEAEEAKAPAQETAAQAPETLTDETVDETEETSFGGGLLKTLLGVGTVIAASSARSRARAAVRRTPVTRTGSALRTPQRAVRIAPHRHPEPPRTGSFGARPARPTQGVPGRTGRSGSPGRSGGPGRAGSMNRGGRGGMGGPGGRHR